MKPTLAVGLAALLVVSGLAYALWGGWAGLAAGIFGAMALAIQLTALALIEPVKQGPIKVFIKRWAVGMGLRALGVAAIAVAAGLDRDHFPPLATAMGYLGVLLPLLFFEVRLVR